MLQKSIRNIEIHKMHSFGNSLHLSNKIKHQQCNLENFVFKLKINHKPYSAKFMQQMLTKGKAECKNVILMLINHFTF